MNSRDSGVDSCQSLTNRVEGDIFVPTSVVVPHCLESFAAVSNIPVLKNLVRMLDADHGSHTKISAFEGIRGVAVFTVFLAHYSTSIAPWIDIQRFGTVLFETMRFYGNYGVEVFFALSGYLIYSGVIRKNFSVGLYAKKRIQRIYPVFLAVLLLYVILSFLSPAHSKFPGGFFPNAFYLLQNMLFVPGLADIPPLISQAWSLSFEAAFYIGLPVLVLIFGFRNWSGPKRTFLIAPVLVLYWIACLSLEVSPSRLSAFALGLLAYELKPYLATLQRSWIIGTLAILLTIPFAAATAVRSMTWSATYIVNCGLIFIFFASCLGTPHALTRFFSLRGLRWFGNMSYTYFLAHGIGIKIGFAALSRFVPPDGHGAMVYWLFMPLCFFLTFVVSLVFYCLVEYPLSIQPMTAHEKPELHKAVVSA